ncbi:TetR/AcrR family transcriptional regulator [Muricoccus aerilatus]|uniref:TetR/AcrR family transcriptional regulator n=1 Tax=Muricoccus aerilatus TaxID=452982 RepID=UPI001470248C|nr:TetR/AcrR family transcriptional regulator [Roseomonas aerilata]
MDAATKNTATDECPRPFSVKPVPVPRRGGQARKAELVLDAAEAAFLRNGFGGTSMDGIAELAGVSKRTVYSNFHSKGELYAAVIRRRCADVAPETLASVAAGQSIEEVLVEMAVSFLRALYEPQQVELYRTVVADARAFPEVGAMMVDGPVRRSQAAFKSYLEDECRKGRLELIDLDLAAAQLIGLLKTDVHMRLVLNQPTDISHDTIVASARSSINLFLNGARSHTAQGTNLKPRARAR